MSWFTQSPEWEELQRREGRKTYRIGGALIIEYPLPFGRTYWEVPRGPEKPENIKALKEYTLPPRRASLASGGSLSKGLVFLRVDPPVKEVEEERPAFAETSAGRDEREVREVKKWREALEELQFRPAPKDYYFSAVSPPPEIAVVDLTQSEEERLARMPGSENSTDHVTRQSAGVEFLLPRMHEKTPYNIRLAERKGVQVEFSRSERLFGEFWQLLSETAQREKFTIHQRQHYVNLLDVFSSAEIGVATLEGESLAAGLFLVFDEWIHYLHGGSTRHHREAMAPYLLHWQAMERAREYALQYYDFGGIAPEGASDHPWGGETRFKMNFGAERVSFLPAHDLVISERWYKAYLLARRVWRIRN